MDKELVHGYTDTILDLLRNPHSLSSLLITSIGWVWRHRSETDTGTDKLKVNEFSCHLIFFPHKNLDNI